MGVGAWFYVLLVAVTLGFAWFVRNREYVPGYLTGRSPRIWDRQRARNLAAEIGVYGFLAGVSACRVAIGADYWVYWANFQLIAQGRHVSYEIGFRYVVRLMQAMFGDGTYRTIFFLFSAVTVFFFLKALHDQAQWYAASLYLLLAGGYYFSSMHSVRYYFALSIALWSAKYVIRGEYGKFLLWILLAASFHKSVLVVIPAYLLARALARRKWKGWQAILAMALIAVLAIARPWWQEAARSVIFYFYPYYEGSAFDVADVSWANVGKCLGTLLLGAICWRTGPGKEDGQEMGETDLANRFYFFLNLGGLVLYTCCAFIPEISRIGYYLIAFQIFLIPNLLQGMKKGMWKMLCVLASMGAFAIYFAEFLYRAYDDSVRLLPYLEWIFH